MDLRLATSLLVVAFGTAQAGLINPGFEQQAGVWSDGEGPPGWQLSLGDEQQRGVVEALEDAWEGDHVFYFDQLDRGFGASRIDQCLSLDDLDALQLSVHLRSDQPDPALALRLRMDFYSDDNCQTSQPELDNQQVQSDIALDPATLPAGEWRKLSSEARFLDDFASEAGSVRVSLRLRDRSDNGQPTDPARIVWLDGVSLQSETPLLPAATRSALRALYQSTDGENWQQQLGWMGSTGSECDWYGVECSSSRTQLIGLRLANNGLTGPLPQSLSDLNDLAYGGLDLCYNALEPDPTLAEWLDQVQLGGFDEQCGSAQPRAFADDQGGALMQADRDGEGLLLNMLGQSTGVLFWLTYDDSGQQQWLIGAGRADQRVMRFQPLYRASEGLAEVEPVGNASLIWNGCQHGLLRYNVELPDGAQAGVRELDYYDRGLCEQRPVVDQPISELAGAWYDPAHDGEGMSLEPLNDGSVIMTWMDHDDQAQPRWMLAIGESVEGGIAFEQLLMPSGGNFSASIPSLALDLSAQGEAFLHWQPGQQPRLELEPDGQQGRQRELSRIEAGPDLLASSGYRLHIQMQPDHLDELYSRSIWSDDRLPGRARLGERGLWQGLTGLRFRGSSTRMLPKKAFNVRFESAQAIAYESDRMNLNAMYTDPALMREALSFELFHQLQLPASRTRFVDLWLNDIYEGLYIHIERVDEDLLIAHGLNPEGTLVRDDFRGHRSVDPLVERDSMFGFDLSGVQGQSPADFLSERIRYRNDPDWQALADLVQWVHDTPAGAEFAQGFEQRVDVDTFVDWLAIHWLVGDIDAFGDDYWLYLDHQQADARWVFIPWDKDLSFGSHFRPELGVANHHFHYQYPLRGGWDNALIQKALQSSPLRQRIDQRLQQLLDELYTAQWIETRSGELAERLADSAAIGQGPNAFQHHPRQHHGQARYAQAVESVVDFVHLRRAYIERQLQGSHGPAYQASRDIDSQSPRRIDLTDAEGFTVATLSVSEDGGWPEQARITASVRHDPAASDVDRRWRIQSDRDLGEVELSLYYRNERADAFSRANWIRGNDDAVGDQERLQIVANGQPLATRVNPLSNKAVTVISVHAGEQEFSLQLPVAGDS